MQVAFFFRPPSTPFYLYFICSTFMLFPYLGFPSMRFPQEGFLMQLADAPCYVHSNSIQFHPSASYILCVRSKIHSGPMGGLRRRIPHCAEEPAGQGSSPSLITGSQSRRASSANRQKSSKSPPKNFLDLIWARSALIRRTRVRIWRQVLGQNLGPCPNFRLGSGRFAAIWCPNRNPCDSQCSGVLARGTCGRDSGRKKGGVRAEVTGPNWQVSS
ncbi:hypothetical protein C8F01DRAFT_1348514, partial [Mycena amicta]